MHKMKELKLNDYFSKLTKVRKPHRCRLCGQRIHKGEKCCSWTFFRTTENPRFEVTPTPNAFSAH